MSRNSGKHKLRFFSIFLVSVILIGSVYWGLSKYNENKTAKAQALFLAQKESERIKLEEEKARLEEAKKQEEQRRIEEEKKQKELKKQQDMPKISMAIKGQGTSKRIPILMYHSIDYEKGNELRIPKEKFREQMKYLKDSGFTPLSMEELYSHIVFGTIIPNKPIVITLDDGYVDNYTNAYPVLKEFGFKATMFMISSAMNNDSHYLNDKQLVEMDQNGVKIESHTVTHPKLDELSYEGQVAELKNSKEALEKVLGREVKYIAYPYGKFNNDTLKISQEAGYEMGLSTIQGVASKSDGLYKLHRIYVSDNYDMNYFKSLVNQK